MEVIRTAPRERFVEFYEAYYRPSRATLVAVGDFDVGGAQHHGTPDQRREAWLLGFESGNPSSCDRYVPAG